MTSVYQSDKFSDFFFSSFFSKVCFIVLCHSEASAEESLNLFEIPSWHTPEILHFVQNDSVFRISISLNSGLTVFIKAIFLFLVHPFNCFSLPIASIAELYSSK